MIKMKPELKKLNLRNPLHFMAVGFGSGLSPIAPGTTGSFAAIPLCYLLTGLPVAWSLIIIMISWYIGIIACQSATDAIGIDDHGAIVWDEFVGMFITTICAPQSFTWMIICFLVFRVFDIFKPWPIKLIDSDLHGGLGIMLDDVLAGLYGLVTIQLWLYFFPNFTL
jgi:phosphatidylglycerophosphatase A